jgi:hypothetical protein
MMLLQLSGIVKNDFLVMVIILSAGFMLLDYKISRQFRKLREDLGEDRKIKRDPEGDYST